ncbi:MAG TPA: ring-cleaving dioxygenase [Thermoanaerobaculia bacterium]|jgi:glyoxalase family protein|nr:ring-cleaving dioxygenase [Thermoanaerobaculia bacterium]
MAIETPPVSTTGPQAVQEDPASDRQDRPITGLHHVTALAGDPQANLDFYTGVLGLRLVKRTVNYDDPATYHLYYGDELGRPGTLLTFFAWPHARRGQLGAGQATVTSFSVPAGSLGFWSERLRRAGVDHDQPRRRGADEGGEDDEEVLRLLDPDGLELELVDHAGPAAGMPWAGGPVPVDRAIRGLLAVTLLERDAERTAEMLTGTLGCRLADQTGSRFRFAVGASGATRLDLVAQPAAARGRISAGTVHHVALRVAGDREQQAWHRDLIAGGHHVSPVMDRRYFHSIYFREPGGVLLEIATDAPGMTVDESAGRLGSGLELPPWLEPSRSRIEAGLPPLVLAGVA